MRNVHTGHAIKDWLTLFGAVVDKAVEEDKVDDGSEDETCWDRTEVVDIRVRTAFRGTPHKLQIRAAAGLRPGGLR